MAKFKIGDFVGVVDEVDATYRVVKVIEAPGSDRVTIASMSDGSYRTVNVERLRLVGVGVSKPASYLWVDEKVMNLTSNVETKRSELQQLCAMFDRAGIRYDKWGISDTINGRHLDGVCLVLGAVVTEECGPSMEFLFDSFGQLVRATPSYFDAGNAVLTSANWSESAPNAEPAVSTTLPIDCEYE